MTVATSFIANVIIVITVVTIIVTGIFTVIVTVNAVAKVTAYFEDFFIAQLGVRVQHPWHSSVFKIRESQEESCAHTKDLAQLLN